MQTRAFPGVALAVLVLAACSDALGPGDQGQVRIGFRLAVSNGAMNNGEMVITGSNGTLRITEIAFIVNEFELEREEDACDSSGPGNECEEFEAPPAFLRPPVTGRNVVVVTQAVPAGTYTELEFEVEDLELDEGNDEAGAIAAAAAAARAAFPQWPDEASHMITGTFTPTGGAPIPFMVFFEAEIEIEKDLAPPLVVDQENETVTIELDPSVWFRRFDGTVMNLAAFDFETTGIVVEFEAELENGFPKIEFED
jgi:hypothetical protein